MRRGNRSRLSTICALIVALLCIACDAPKQGAVGEADSGVDTGAGSGSGSGEGSGSATCWFETGAGFCPAQPRGLAAADCPGPRLQDPSLALGTALCAVQTAAATCADGWTSLPALAEGSGLPLPAELAALTRCEPPAEPPDDCPPGFIALPGADGCQRMGVACPPVGDRWHDEATLRALAPGFTGPILYISPDATADGAGTRESPRLLSSATVRAAQDGILALSTGTHTSAVRLDRHVALLGSCVEATTLTTSQASDSLGVVDISPSGAVAVSNLTITGARPGIWVHGEVATPHEIEAVTIAETPVYGLIADSPQVIRAQRVRLRDLLPRPSTQTLGRGIELQNGARLVAEGLAVERATEVGVVVSGAGTTLEANDLVVQQTLPRATDRAFGRGLVVNAGGTAQLQNALLRDNTEVGISLSGEGATLDAERLLILRTRPNVRTLLGRGLELKGGAQADLRDAILRGNHQLGLYISDAQSALVASRLQVDETQLATDNSPSAGGMRLQAGAAATLEQALFRNNNAFGVEVVGPGTTLRFDRLSVADTAPSSSLTTTSGGLLAREGATATGDDLLLARNHGLALFISEAGSTADVRRARIWNTLTRGLDDRQGEAIHVADGGRLAATDLHLDNNREVAIDIRDTGSQVQLDRLLVEQTQPRASDGRAGRAIELSAGAELDVADAILRESHELALFVSGNATRFTADRLLIEATAPQPRTGLLGHGISLQGGATATLSDLLLRGNHGIALIVTDAATAVELHRVAIADTAPHPADGRFGIGLGLYNRATLRGDDIALLRNRRCALQVAGTGITLALDRIRLSGSEVGANLQADNFGLEVLQQALQNEQYDGNGQDVAFLAIELPDPASLLSDLPTP